MLSHAIPSLILLSSSVYATPVYISDVKAAREAGHLRVEVYADGGIDPDNASTVIDEGRLIIYLGGTRVHADNRSWELQDGAGEIRAHRHKTQTELVVPLTGNGCAGPVELTGTDTGIAALVGCDGAVAAVPKTMPARTPRTSKKSEPELVKLKQLVELPAAGAVAAPLPTPAPAAVQKLAPAATQEPLLRVASASVGATTPKTVAPPIVAAPVVGSVAETAQAQPIAASTSGGLRAVALPAFLLAVLAAVAYAVSRRRRGPNLRHIEILETTSLGPKRSLICARIGEETVILSSSEAGISLLRGSTTSTATAASTATSTSDTATGARAGGAPALAASTSDDVAGPRVVPGAAVLAARPVAMPDPETRFEDHFLELEQPLEEALADIPDPRPAQPNTPARAAFRAIEGGLAGLFAKRDGHLGREEMMSSPFEDILEDSLEDQELRQKLAAGMSSRVR